MLKRLLYLGIGTYVYLLSQLTIILLIVFTGNLHPVLGMDRAAGTSLGYALIIDISLIVLFGIQHSLMSRRSVKEWLRSWLPRPLERAVFCLMASLCLILLIFCWQPIPGYCWKIQSFSLQVCFYFLFFLGWLIMFTATFLINHWDLFGLRQVYLYWRQRPYTALIYRDPFLYKKLRHPLYLGFLIAFWCSPTMSIAHLVFACLMTIYILLGIRWEEQDLIQDFGEIYSEYKGRVPKLFPRV
ncbi:MAG: isoprenylcysteine carboxylmethyltransferase family protein [Saprospiraceae bacterium]|nr:isoprenylcysteine carboxylmethyltransferase family protein [Saprospiraceae bacterium]